MYIIKQKYCLIVSANMLSFSKQKMFFWVSAQKCILDGVDVIALNPRPLKNAC